MTKEEIDYLEQDDEALRHMQEQEEYEHTQNYMKYLQNENEELKKIDESHHQLVGKLIAENKELKKENESLKDTIRINNCVNESGIIQNQSAKIAELEEENKKQKEILDIIKNKCVISTFDLGYSDTVEEYNELYPLDSQLTDEEFKKIKEWLND